MGNSKLMHDIVENTKINLTFSGYHSRESLADYCQLGEDQ
ncbi:634_t:CDS:2 [Racocetra fulgida]|uniref:634_t:CDS:1 n=1 Tax=Racocetra fulgida TaxID=60492 RepID=A0A9N8VQL4_9GLOM|nr:634_t:CDS:2 [Racocetra fulgida]